MLKVLGFKQEIMARKLAVAFLLPLLTVILCSAQPPFPGFTLMGNVSYPGGVPAKGVQVRVEDRALSQVLWTGETDGDGFFTTKARLKVEQGSTLVVSAWTESLFDVEEVGVAGSVAWVELELRVGKKPKKTHHVEITEVSVSPACFGDSGVVVLGLANEGDYDEYKIQVYLLAEEGWETENKTVAYLFRGGKQDVNLTVMYSDFAEGAYVVTAVAETKHSKSEEKFVFKVVDCRETTSSSTTSTTTTMFPRPPLTTIPYLTTMPKTTSTLIPRRSCFNGVLDADEEGVDCGGVCPPCKEEEVSLFFWGVLGVLVVVFGILIAILLYLMSMKK